MHRYVRDRQADRQTGRQTGRHASSIAPAQVCIAMSKMDRHTDTQTHRLAYQILTAISFHRQTDRQRDREIDRARSLALTRMSRLPPLPPTLNHEELQTGDTAPPRPNGPSKSLTNFQLYAFSHTFIDAHVTHKPGVCALFLPVWIRERCVLACVHTYMLYYCAHSYTSICFTTARMCTVYALLLRACVHQDMLYYCAHVYSICFTTARMCTPVYALLLRADVLQAMRS